MAFVDHWCLVLVFVCWSLLVCLSFALRSCLLVIIVDCRVVLAFVVGVGWLSVWFAVVYYCLLYVSCGLARFAVCCVVLFVGAVVPWLLLLGVCVNCVFVCVCFVLAAVLSRLSLSVGDWCRCAELFVVCGVLALVV